MSRERARRTRTGAPSRLAFAAGAAAAALAAWGLVPGELFPAGSSPSGTPERVAAPGASAGAPSGPGDGTAEGALGAPGRREGASASDDARARPGGGAAVAPSLKGTTIDGGLRVGPEGHLRPGPDTRRFFDYFLAASGELAPDALRAQVVAEIDRRLAEPARSEAVALLDRYLAYREEARALTQRGEVPAGLERRLQWLRELRRGKLGASDARALFGREEARAERALARRRVLEDPDLSAEERRARLEALDAEAPPEARETARAPRELLERERALRAEGASPGELRALRERAVGAEAADRLEALDRRRARFEERVDAYRAELEAELRGRDLAPEERSARRERLRAEHFGPRERLRVRALDRQYEGASAAQPGRAAQPDLAPAPDRPPDPDR